MGLIKEGILTQKINPKTGRKEYALVSREKHKALKYFGTQRPSSESVAKEERRVEYFKKHSEENFMKNSELTKIAYELGQKVAYALGPYDVDRIAKQKALDASLAAKAYNRKNNFGHYLLNPYVGGPLFELGNMISERANATKYEHPYGSNISDLLTGASSAIHPGLGLSTQLINSIIQVAMGNKDIQNKMREHYSELPKRDLK